MSPACRPFTYMSGKAEQECNLVWSGEVSEKGVHTTEVGAEVDPVCPISQPDLVSRSHDPVGTVSPSSNEQTSEVLFVFGRSSSQEACCVRGKSEVKRVRNSRSVSE